MDNITLGAKDKKIALVYGLIFGVIVFLTDVILTYVLKSATSLLTLTALPIVLSVLLPLGIAIFLCLSLRKRVGGYWSLRQATSGIFIMFMSAYILSNVGGIVFTKVIEPDIVGQMKENMIVLTTKMGESLHMGQEQIDAKVADIERNFKNKEEITVGNTIKGFFIAIIIVFVVSLFFAAIFKKEPPLFVSASENGEA